MKKLIFTFIISFSFCNLFAQDFEGIIEQQVFHQEQNRMINISWYIKDNHIRLDMNDEDGKVSLLINSSEKMIILSDWQITEDGQQYYYDMNANDIESTLQNINPIILTKMNTQPDRFYSKELEIGGNINGNLNYTTDIKLPLDYLAFFKDNIELLILSKNDLEGFPLSSTLKDDKGNLVSHIKLIKIESQTLADEEFEIPNNLVSHKSLQAE